MLTAGAVEAGGIEGIGNSGAAQSQGIKEFGRIVEYSESCADVTESCLRDDASDDEREREETLLLSCSMP